MRFKEVEEEVMEEEEEVMEEEEEEGTVLFLSIHCPINSWDYFLKVLATIISRKKLPFVDITHNYILYSVDSHAGRGLLQVVCGSSNSQN